MKRSFKVLDDLNVKDDKTLEDRMNPPDENPEDLLKCHYLKQHNIKNAMNKGKSGLFLDKSLGNIYGKIMEVKKIIQNEYTSNVHLGPISFTFKNRDTLDKWIDVEDLAITKPKTKVWSYSAYIGAEHYEDGNHFMVNVGNQPGSGQYYVNPIKKIWDHFPDKAILMAGIVGLTGSAFNFAETYLANKDVLCPEFALGSLAICLTAKLGSLRKDWYETNALMAIDVRPKAMQYTETEKINYEKMVEEIKRIR